MVVKPTRVTARTYKAATRLYFVALSPVLDAAAKAELRAPVRKTGTDGVLIKVVGYVPSVGGTPNRPVPRPAASTSP